MPRICIFPYPNTEANLKNLQDNKENIVDSLKEFISNNEIFMDILLEYGKERINIKDNWFDCYYIRDNSNIIEAQINLK